MVGMVRIGSAPESANPIQAGQRVQKDASSEPVVSDVVQLSRDSQDASVAARFFGETESQAKAQAERISRIQESLKRGTHKVQQVVQQVAATLTKYLSLEPAQDSSPKTS
jgi:hypothetical protein